MKFELIKGTKNLHGTCYFEFVKYSDKIKTCWNENAYYLKDSIFNFFIKVFSKSSDRFDYFSFCKFNQSELKSLNKNLDSFRKSLTSAKSLEEFESLFENSYINIFFDDEKKRNWKLKVDELIEISKSLKQLVDECLKENQVFWVLGL